MIEGTAKPLHAIKLVFAYGKDNFIFYLAQISTIEEGQGYLANGIISYQLRARIKTWYKMGSNKNIKSNLIFSSTEVICKSKLLKEFFNELNLFHKNHESHNDNCMKEANLF